MQWKYRKVLQVPILHISGAVGKLFLGLDLWSDPLSFLLRLHLTSQLSHDFMRFLAWSAYSAQKLFRKCIWNDVVNLRMGCGLDDF